MLMSPHGMDAENALQHKEFFSEEDDGIHAHAAPHSSRSVPMSPDSMVKHKFNEHPESSTPTKREMLRRAGIDNLTTPPPPLLLDIHASHNSHSLFSNKENDKLLHTPTKPSRPAPDRDSPSPRPQSPIEPASMVFAAAMAMRRQRVPTQTNKALKAAILQSQSLLSSPRKKTFEDRYRLDQKVKEAARKLMSPTTEKNRSKTSAMIDDMKSFVSKIEDKREAAAAKLEKKNAWKKGGGQAGRTSQLVKRPLSPIRSPTKLPPSIAETKESSDDSSFSSSNSEQDDLGNSPLLRRRTMGTTKAPPRRTAATSQLSPPTTGRQTKLVTKSNLVMKFKRKPAAKKAASMFRKSTNDARLGIFSYLSSLPPSVYIPIVDTVVLDFGSNLCHLHLPPSDDNLFLNKDLYERERSEWKQAETRDARREAFWRSELATAFSGATRSPGSPRANPRSRSPCSPPITPR